MEEIRDIFTKIKREAAKVIVGQEEVVDGIVTAILAGGHVLLEGPPGVAKTLMARVIARAVTADFKRIQFTPDLMPLDVIGTNIFDFAKQNFLFKQGPIFTDLLLADEINRTPPKTQSALLEAMEERKVTIDGVLHELSPLFTVLATENPIEYEGTYPLPEAQLDRFFAKLEVTYPSAEYEEELYRRYQNGMVGTADLQEVEPVVTVEEILKARESLSAITVRAEIIDFVTKVIRSTREHPLLALGASPRGGIHLLLAGKICAAAQGRDYVTPEDVLDMVYPVLRHRLLVKTEALVDGRNADSIIKNILAQIKVPR